MSPFHTEDLGPVYGFQWKHFGAKYVHMHTGYSGQGVDQLAQVIQTTGLTQMTGESSCLPGTLVTDQRWPCLPAMPLSSSTPVYQRSADMGLGVPFNIASYSLLTYMIALICNLKPGDFVHTLTDAHVYLNHIQPLTIQLQRSPRPFPRLELRRQVSDIDKFVYDDIILHDYQDTHGHGCLASFIPFPC
ncbi:Thymidylate synthase [Geodia barretti]|uniref:Thymidylate synthase n=1 Tax=Geodia barretti TaxID=519541 RepID=A0AA35QVX7_GEOBA|nr:Thymidylate synthase [Geodia barretti]